MSAEILDITARLGIPHPTSDPVGFDFEATHRMLNADAFRAAANVIREHRRVLILQIETMARLENNLRDAADLAEKS